ncbi:ribonuclease G [Lacticaseibacillus zhaodongensis]|uniref:ribonuclease G n=1 Tax=Lacticaseibacillus zhaodongensis TaxID=2668065 RepID=UPI0012D31D41|nr:ribonuclease G [Lacticaseibacillus zhaodongensis]
MDQNEEIIPGTVPAGVKGWNWGAFMFNWIWGVGNKTYLPLLCLIPLFNIIWVFVCGAKGNEWAWKSGDYRDVATFTAVQKTWSRAGLVQFIVAIVIVVLYIAIVGSAIGALMHNLNS